ncbi:MAG: cytochrome c [Acidobacteria bacterium]|nr:cytochrome c [Acidobacteriota bacterium]
MKTISAGLLLFVGSLILAADLTAPDASAGLSETGAELFRNNCARCHGVDAKGGEGPDLTDPERKQKWKDSDERIVFKVTNGGRRMPSFSDKLTAEEIKEIAAFVRSL